MDNEKEMLEALGIDVYEYKSELLMSAYSRIKFFYKQIDIIRDIFKEMDEVADSQKFGLSYGQAIDYLEKIRNIVGHYGRKEIL